MADFLPVGTPVSHAIAASDDIRGVVHAVLIAVDSVHRDGDLSIVPVNIASALTTKYAEANYYYDALFDEAIEIQVAFDAETPELSFLHELAHFIDHKGLNFKFYLEAGYGSTVGAVKQAVFASETNPKLSAWREAALSSEAVTQLQRLAEYRSAAITLSQGAKVAVDIDQAYVNYLLEFRELFARSYSQYIVTNSQTRTLQRQLDSVRQEPLAVLYPLYWEDEDFLAISDAFDLVLQERGWMI